MSKRLVGADGTIWDCIPKGSLGSATNAEQGAEDTMITYACRRADEPRSEPRYIRVPTALDLDDPVVAASVAPTIP
jgi:hypothetical protein